MEYSKTFCCITRNNQGNCEARKGKWFPLAQTPTSIIVFSNERLLIKRQMRGHSCQGLKICQYLRNQIVPNKKPSLLQLC